MSDENDDDDLDPFYTDVCGVDIDKNMLSSPNPIPIDLVFKARSKLKTVWQWFGLIFVHSKFPYGFNDSFAPAIPKNNNPRTFGEFRAVVQDNLMLKWYLGIVFLMCIPFLDSQNECFHKWQYGGLPGNQTND
eukprot:4620330-Karenia_brevis.AAC.1